MLEGRPFRCNVATKGFRELALISGSQVIAWGHAAFESRAAVSSAVIVTLPRSFTQDAQNKSWRGKWSNASPFQLELSLTISLVVLLTLQFSWSGESRLNVCKTPFIIYPKTSFWLKEERNDVAFERGFDAVLDEDFELRLWTCRVWMHRGRGFESEGGTTTEETWIFEGFREESRGAVWIFNSEKRCIFDYGRVRSILRRGRARLIGTSDRLRSLKWNICDNIAFWYCTELYFI